MYKSKVQNYCTRASMMKFSRINGFAVNEIIHNSMPVLLNVILREKV